MRIGTRTDDPFLASLGQKESAIKEKFAAIMKRCTTRSEKSVMLGDSTVKTVETFEPARTSDVFSSITTSLSNWDIQKVSTTQNEDKRRLFTKFATTENGYKLSGHLSLQYHVILYYAPEQRVLDAQSELAKLIDSTASYEDDHAKIADEIIKTKLQQHNIDNANEQELFELLYNDENLQNEITSEINTKTDPKSEEMIKRKAGLYAELDRYLLEVYETTSVLIDESRLVGGEEGYVFTLDIESESGPLDASSIDATDQEKILDKFSQLESAINQINV